MEPHELNPVDQGILLKTVEEVLALRENIALTVVAVHRRAAMIVDFKIELAHVQAALDALKNWDPPLAKTVFGEFATEAGWQITTQGVLHFKRNLK